MRDDPDPIERPARGVPEANGYPWWSDLVGYGVWGLIGFGWVPVALALGAIMAYLLGEFVRQVGPH